MAKATLNDVSALAGVSRSTASLVLRGSTRIPAQTHERVRQAMAELGYVYNRQAANMRASASMTVGLIATDIRNPYFAELTMAIADSLHDSAYTLFTVYTRDDLDRQGELVKAMIERQVDGILMLPSIGSTAPAIRDMLGTSTPLVQIARHFSNEFDYAGPDNTAAAAVLAEHLASVGRGRAVLVGGPHPSSARGERLAGLTAGFSGAGIEFDADESVPTENNPDGGARGLAELLDRGMLPDIVIAYSDAVALGIYSELRRRNLEPGRDMAVASFDDVPFAGLQMPQLTSVATHPVEVGRVGAQLLIERIQDPGREIQHMLVAPALRARASTVLWRPRS
ncbi:MAG: LacI family DNA-binding transcriptional regulator [Microcella sp.]|uniref:LacI family DNA-binding transcriptional regulator n=1 Tax=Microcella sp. TaxID=1913979 RepID=UPI0033152B49